MALTVINHPDELSYTRNPMMLSVQLEGDEEFSDFYALCIVMNASNDTIVTLFARPDIEFKVEFDLSSIIDTLTSFHLPNFSTLGEKVTDFVTTYKYNVVQYSDGIARDDTGIITKHAIKGGLSQEHDNIDIFTKMESRKMFLSWISEARVVTSQPYFLQYLHLKADEFLTAKARVFYTDGTDQITTLIDFGEVATYNLLCVASGFTQLGLDALQPEKTPASYWLWIENSGSVIRAGYFKFKIADSYAPYPQVITYGNSLGGMDYIHLRGNVNRSLEPTATELIRTTSNGEIVIAHNTLIEQKQKVSTGFISKTQLQALTDLFTSKEVYEYNPVLGALQPVVMSTKTKYEYNETDNLYALTLEYSRAAKNRNFTPDDASKD